MPLPKPIPGLVIRYSYLWCGEYLEGREEGQKDRPCAIVAANRADNHGTTRVLVLPVTHSPPDDPGLAVDARSWVVLSEWNEFIWPGPDLRRLPGADDSSVAYGMLPPSLFALIRDRFLALVKSRASGQVRRT